MNNKLELNKYDKKTLELQKKVCSFKTEQKKDHRAVWGGLLLNKSFVFLHMKKIGTILHILITLLNLKQKSNNSKYWLYLGNCPLIITDTLVMIFFPLCAEYFIGLPDQHHPFTLKTG